MDPTTIEAILKFYVQSLPEDKLAELDALLAGDVSAMASDSARLSPDRREFMALDARTRHAVRKSRDRRSEQYGRDRAELGKLFPHANRLG